MAKILVIDDEPRILDFVARALTSAGYAVSSRSDGLSGLDAAIEGSFDLVILDLRLPGISGEAVLAKLRAERPRQAVIMLSGMSDVADKVRLLNLGADDYITKPFASPELLARVVARLRALGEQADGPVLEVGRVVLDHKRRTVDVGTGPVQLTDREFRLLSELMRRPGVVCTREELLAEVWGYWFDPGSNVVDVVVRRLRRKLGDGLVLTVRNVGYVFSGG